MDGYWEYNYQNISKLFSFWQKEPPYDMQCLDCNYKATTVLHQMPYKILRLCKHNYLFF